MGVMEKPLLLEQPPMVFTPHPVTLDGQEFLPVDLREGETLGSFLDRTIDLGADAWEVKIGGVVVPVEMWDRVKPKHGQLIEVRGAVKKQALYIVAYAFLTWWTMGALSTAMAAGGISGLAAGAVAIGSYVAGAMIINKVLGPKPPKAQSQDRESVFNIAGSRNALRPHEPLGLLLGSVRLAPDLLSQPYSWYEGNDQYLALRLTPGINADRFDDLYLGDTLLSQYDGVEVWTSGFPGMPEQAIPLHSNADTIAGGELNKDGTWVVRTTPPDTLRVMVNIEYMLGDTDSKGRPYYNKEVVDVEYSVPGANAWISLTGRMFSNNNYDTKRATITHNIPKGQWDIRVRRRGMAWEEQSGKAAFNFTSLTCVQVDEADYRGIPQIGIKIKATGQLNGTPDQIRAVFHACDMPVWTGSAWATATDRASGLSNPGAIILQYARGFYDRDGVLVGGMGLDDININIQSLQAFMAHCDANGYTFDWHQMSVRSHEEMLSAIALAGFGQISWAGGRLSVVWAAASQPLSGVVNMATIKRGTFQVDYTLAGGADGIEYTYFDRDVWDTRTLRVPAPGVVTMLNPARLTGEGVTTEAHAAKMARYHMAQHLYQYKDISFSTDLEHLSYQRLSRLALQHDLTKWGSGGRLQGASIVGGVVSIALDEPVTAPATGDAYIGLRIPSESVYRVFKVQPFTGEATTLSLVEEWPAGVPLPGSSEDNPAHDTVWIYDFKQTPGYSVRVVSIEPESDLKGARVTVVPETADFWTYVNTGAYEPPVNPPASNDRPIASNLVVSERQLVQGNTEYTELVATFDVSGYASHSVVYAALMPDGELEEVAQTNTRTASWRIEEQGEYAVVVRPFDASGDAGTSVSTIYITQRADNPPPVFDTFTVTELSGGVRKYDWGYNPTTQQPANLAGAEIRYVAGIPRRRDTGSPTWDDMTPLGEGFFTSSMEMVIPPAGDWTFAIRSRNTSGFLSTGMRVVAKTLGLNLGQELEDQQSAIDQAAYDAALAQAAAAESLALHGTHWDAGTAYEDGVVVYIGGRMYRAIQPSIGVEPPDSAYWQYVGTVTEAQGQTSQALSQLRVDVDEQGEEFAAAITQVRTGGGDGGNQIENAELAAVSGVAWDVLDWPGQILMEVNLAGDAWRAAGTNNLGFTSSATVGNGVDAVMRWTRPMACEPGDNVIAAARLANHRCAGFIRILFLDASGAELDSAQSDINTSITGGPSLAQHAKVVARKIAPAGTAQAVLQWWSRGLGQESPYSWITRPQMEIGRPGQTEPSAWSVGGAGLATATFALQAAQDAQITLTTDVNGHVSGMYSANDGRRSIFTILSEVFRVITSGSVGMEWQDGYLRAYAGSIQLIFGINFGSQSNLCFWYGPNVGAASCTKANGTIWFDNTGSAYFGGSLSAGVLKNAAQSSQLSTSASVSTGTFASNNKPRVVVGSFVFTKSYSVAGNSPVNASYSGTLDIKRGATQLASIPISVTYSSVYDSETNATVISAYGNASVTHTDNTAGTSFDYSASLTQGPVNWITTGGTHNAAQTVSIISTEEP